MNGCAHGYPRPPSDPHRLLPWAKPGQWSRGVVVRSCGSHLNGCERVYPRPQSDQRLVLSADRAHSFERGNAFSAPRARIVPNKGFDVTFHKHVKLPFRHDACVSIQLTLSLENRAPHVTRTPHSARARTSTYQTHVRTSNNTQPCDVAVSEVEGFTRQTTSYPSHSHSLSLSLSIALAHTLRTHLASRTYKCAPP